MPVEVYVKSDTKGRPVPPAHGHEIRGIVANCQRTLSGV